MTSYLNERQKSLKSNTEHWIHDCDFMDPRFACLRDNGNPPGRPFRSEGAY
jgi:hypothetical protein